MMFFICFLFVFYLNPGLRPSALPWLTYLALTGLLKAPTLRSFVAYVGLIALRAFCLSEAA